MSLENKQVENKPVEKMSAKKLARMFAIASTVAGQTDNG